jgi:spermidine/putrescine transport system substrate-binding protein
MMLRLRISLLSVVGLIVMGCGADPAIREPAASSRLTLAAWPDEFPTAVLDSFEQAFNAQILFVSYDDQDWAADQVRQDDAAYDVLVLGNELVGALRQEGKLLPIDYAVVQNITHLGSRFLNLAYDPENRYSVPYNWGATSVIVGDELVEVEGFADLWGLAQGGKVITWQVMRFAFGAALKTLGYSINSEDPLELAAAGERLMQIAPSVIFPGDNDVDIGTALTDGRAVAGWNAYSRDAMSAQAVDASVRWILPTEGFIVWGDNYTIPVTSSNQALAQQFINFMHQPEIAAQIVEWNQYATPNEAALEFMEPALRDNVLIFPLPRDMANAEILLPISAEAYAIQQAIWNEFVAAVEAQAQGT